MNIAFYGSSLLSSYWNGAATYYRGLIRDLSTRGYHVTFYEPDAFERQQHRDFDPPDWCKVVVYPATEEGVQRVIAQAAAADVVVKASGVGVYDELLLEETMRAAKSDAIKIFWDVDAPATLAELRRSPEHPLRKVLPSLDMVLTYGGGPPVVAAYEGFSAKSCVPIYNALDPQTHHPAPADPRFVCDLAFLGNRLPDREERVATFFLVPAARLRNRSFLIGGNGWHERALPPNVQNIGHVYTKDHNAFNSTPLAVLNIAREDMASIGFSPATRVFEATGAGAALITDAWEGIELFLRPGTEILVARDGKDVADCLEGLSPERSYAIGQAARARVLADHTYARRGAEVDALLRMTRVSKQERAVA